MIVLDHPIKNYITDTDLTGLFGMSTGALSKFNTFCNTFVRFQSHDEFWHAMSDLSKITIGQ